MNRWIGAAAVMLAANTATAQQADTVQRTRKSPVAAALWSTVVPGAGQMYAGQTAGGFLLLTATVAGFGYYYAPRDTLSFRENCHGGGGGDLCDVKLRPRNKSGLIAGVGLWALSIAMAPGAAREHNRKYRLAADVAPSANGSTRLGLSVQF